MEIADGRNKRWIETQGDLGICRACRACLFRNRSSHLLLLSYREISDATSAESSRLYLHALGSYNGSRLSYFRMHFTALQKCLSFMTCGAFFVFFFFPNLAE